MDELIKKMLQELGNLDIDARVEAINGTQQKSNAYERYLQMMKQKREEDGQMSLFTA